MKLGLGLYRHQLDFESYRFARQCGCTHLALHLTAGFPPPAEEAGVTLAAHIRQPDGYGQAATLNTNGRHAVEFSVAETAASIGGGVYGALETCLRERRMACLRVGNVRGGPSSSYGTFVDDGDVDIQMIVRLLAAGGYGGMILPGDAPRMDCAAPWHAGMAHTLGYLKAAVQASGMPG